MPISLWKSQIALKLLSGENKTRFNGLFFKKNLTEREFWTVRDFSTVELNDFDIILGFLTA